MTEILNFLRGALPLMAIMAAKTKTTVDDQLIAFLQAVLAAPPAQAAAMLTAANAQMAHMAATSQASQDDDKPKKAK